MDFCSVHDRSDLFRCDHGLGRVRLVGERQDMEKQDLIDAGILDEGCTEGTPLSRAMENWLDNNGWIRSAVSESTGIWVHPECHLVLLDGNYRVSLVDAGSILTLFGVN